MFSLTAMVAINVILSYIPWTAVFIITRLFGIRLYYIKGKEECQRIQKRMNDVSSHTTETGKGYGYSFGRWYLLSLSVSDTDYEEKYTCYMVATKKSFEALTKPTDSTNMNPLLAGVSSRSGKAPSKSAKMYR